MKAKLVLLSFVIMVAAVVAEPDPASKRSTSGGSLILSITISRSSSDKPNSVQAVSLGKKVSFNCRANPLPGILKGLLGVSKTRIVADTALWDELYDVEFRFAPPGGRESDLRLGGRKPEFEILIQAICRAADVQLQELTEERDVWVATHQGEKLQRSHSPPSGGGAKDGFSQFQGTRMSLFLQAIESKCECLMEDETDLAGAYDLSYPSGADISAIADHLAAKYGIKLTKARRQVTLYKINRVAESS